MMNALIESWCKAIFSQFLEPAILVSASAPAYLILEINEAEKQLHAHASPLSKNNGLIDFESQRAPDSYYIKHLKTALNKAVESGKRIMLPAVTIQGSQAEHENDFQSSARSFQTEIFPILNEEGNVDLLIILRHDLPLHQQITDANWQVNLLKAQLSVEREKITELELRTAILTKATDQVFDLDAALRGHGTVMGHPDSLRYFLMQAPAGIAILKGVKLIFELVNPHYQELFPGRLLIGKSIFEALPELLGKAVEQQLNDTFTTGKLFLGTEYLVPILSIESGKFEDRYFNFIFQARYDEFLNVDGILIFVFEVTDLVNAKRQIQESELRYRSILNSMPHIAWTINLAGAVTFVNDRWYEYNGRKNKLAAAEMWLKNIHPDDLDNSISQIRQTLKGKTGGEFEVRYQRYDGSYRWFLNRMRLIRDENGKAVFWIGTSTDIQELKWLNQQKDDFVNIASHELKTPLTSLKVSIQLINERIDTLSTFMLASLVHRANKSLDKVVSLVDDLLNVGKMSQGQLSLDKCWFNASSIIVDYAKILTLEGNYFLDFKGQTTLELYGDPKRIDQVVINIVNNAIKYAPESQIIAIQIDSTPSGARISISDKGPGISPELIPHLFDRYYHVENRDFQNTGLGLGLYICAEIIHKHGGEINVISSPGAGSTFWFSLPFLINEQLGKN